MTDFAALRSKAAARKAKRAEKAATLWKKKPKRKKLPSMRRVKKAAWDALSQYVRARDAAKNGGRCLICSTNPIELAYHIWPASAGSAAKWNPLGIVGGCGPCNYGEVNNRAEYVFKHIEIFGFEAVEKLRLESKQFVQYKRHDFLAMAAEWTAKRNAIGGANA